MVEQLGGNNVEQNPENPEDQKHGEFEAAIREEERIMDEIDKIIADAPTREEGEKIALEKYSHLMDEAVKKSSILLKEWIEESKKRQESYEREARGQQG